MKQKASNIQLVPNKLEGGNLVWQGTQWFLNEASQKLDLPDQLRGRRVLDLGCGHGLIGLKAVENKSRHVYFQDLSNKVLRRFTKPNVLKNLPEIKFHKTLYQNCKYYHSISKPKITLLSTSWDNWLSSNEIIPKKYFDFILSSETLYRPQNYNSILKLIQKLLRPKSGRALFITQRCYFGVGPQCGGTVSFLPFLTKYNQNNSIQINCHIKFSKNNEHSSILDILELSIQTIE